MNRKFNRGTNLLILLMLECHFFFLGLETQLSASLRKCSTLHLISSGKGQE